MTHDELVEKGFTIVCRAADVPQAMPKTVEFAGRRVLVCRDGEDLFAVDESCPHENKSMKYGVVFNGRIICPHHQYAFDLDTGRCNRRRCAPVQTYELALCDGTVYLR